MTIHAFAGEKASRTHENLMLQTFLERLEDRWSQSTDWIFVVANAMWEGAEVDLVCLLPTMIFVGDFKSYRGRISGTENGHWFADGVPVKGGSQKNPYVQLRNNRYSIINWLKSRASLDGRNLNHVSAGVVFSGPIIDELDISQRSKTWFHVTDLDHCATTLDCLASPDLSLRRDEAEHIIQALGVEPHQWQSSRPTLRAIGGQTSEEQKPPITPHQREALTAISHFLRAGQHRSMSVLGMTSTGKSRLLCEVIEEVSRLGRKAIPLTPNARLAHLARDEHSIDCQSVYQHMYLTTESEPRDQGVGATEEADAREKQKSASAMIPLRECADPDDCVYLVDDAHLLGDALFRTIDGKQYGSGHLLSDLFAFGGIGKGQRQIVFFGDPYQIQRAAAGESVIDGTFQALQGVAHVSLSLDQVIDVGGGKALLRNAQALVEALREQRFSSLSFDEDGSFRIVDGQTAARELLEHFRGDPFAAWYLAETNAKVSEFVRWLRPRLHQDRSTRVLEPGDLLELISASSSRQVGVPDSRRIRPGRRYCVHDIGPSQIVEQTLRGRDRPITFKVTEWISLEGSGVLADDHAGTVTRVIEDYLVADKPELSSETALAVRVWAKPKRPPRDSSNPEATVDHDEGEERGLPGVTLVRYGYGATVHRAQGGSQELCYVNGDHAAGRHSDAYFRWLYTALTAAERTLSLFNFRPIHPFDAFVWNARSAQVSADIPVGAGWCFDPELAISERDQQRDVPEGLTASRSLSVSIAIWLKIERAIEQHGWSVTKASCAPYREKYELTGPGGSLQLGVAYDGKHVVRALHLDDEGQWPLLCAIATTCLLGTEFTSNAKRLVAELGRLMAPGDWHVVSATESDWRLSASLVRRREERVLLEINFDKQGLVSTIRPLKCSSLHLIEEIPRLLQ